MPNSVHVIGAGGHAKVVIATLRAAGFDVEAAWDDDPARIGTSVLGVQVAGRTDACPAGVAAVLAIGSNSARREVALRLKLRFISTVHPGAQVHESVTIGAGSVVFAGAVIQPDTRVGQHVIVNTAAAVDHDCTLEDFVHVAPGVMLAGGVRLGEGAFLGTGVSAIPGVAVGAWATIGAGAVVVRSIAPRVTAYGCPARVRDEGTPK